MRPFTKRRRRSGKNGLFFVYETIRHQLINRSLVVHFFCVASTINIPIIGTRSGIARKKISEHTQDEESIQRCCLFVHVPLCPLTTPALLKKIFAQHAHTHLRERRRRMIHKIPFPFSTQFSPVFMHRGFP